MTSIVVIDDDRFMRESVIDVLEIKGYKVIGASDGAAGVTLIMDNKPDLVLCDVNMPTMDGFVVLEQMRYDEKTADIPFIFLTARGERDDMRRGMALGADDYLPKPFTAEELLTAVQTQLDKRNVIAQKYEDTIAKLRNNIVYALPHELRTPLAGSLGYAEVLCMDAETMQPDEVRDIASHIVRNNQRLHHVLENYLIYAQLEVLAADPQRVEQLRDYSTPDAGMVITIRAQAKALDFKRTDDLQLDVEDVQLSLAEDNLDKIIAELVDNAFKFSTAGTPVTVHATCDKDSYVIRVSDQGRGMSPQQIASIGAYMQFDRRVFEQQGLGLGLIICKRLAELHASIFTIRSEPDCGTEVQVRIPL
jgi:DNA-binding response OmpR family regulator